MIRQDNKIFFNSGNLETSLQVGVYVPKFTPDKALYLDQIENFEYKSMVGHNTSYESLVIDHFNKTDGSFGGLFTGISGSGKTQTIKNICVKLGLPVILVNDALNMNHLMSIQQNIGSDVIFFFDEFEKIYVEDTSETLLSFFDGVKFNNRVISFASLNEHRKLSSFLFNRPGRFLFNFRFNPLKVEEVIEEFNAPVEYRERLVEFLDKVNDLSWDIVFRIKELIEIHGYDNFEIVSSSINISVSEYHYKVNFEITDEKGVVTVKTLEVEAQSFGFWTPHMKDCDDETASGWISDGYVSKALSGEKVNIKELCFDQDFKDTIFVFTEKIKKYSSNYSSLVF